MTDHERRAYGVQEVVLTRHMLENSVRSDVSVGQDRVGGSRYLDLRSG